MESLLKINYPSFDQLEYVKDIRYVKVNTAQDNGYHFSLGAAVIKHKNVLRVCFSNSLLTENADNTILFEKYSYDDGNTWHSQTIADVQAGYGRSHGVYFEFEGNLYVFCPKAKFKDIDKYPDLQMEGYILNDKGSYDCLGTIIKEPFWPMCSPIKISDSKYILSGLNPETREASVAICENDIRKWKVICIKNHAGFTNWGESTIIKRENYLLLLSRGGGKENILTSYSHDEGDTWSDFEISNFPIVHSKLYAGTLSNKTEYLVFNFVTNGEKRDTLAIAIGKNGFNKIQVIRHGFESKPKYWFANEWCYPYLYEDKEENKIYIVYSLNKEDCEMAIIEIDNLV